jgi:hypothetical protein
MNFFNSKTAETPKYLFQYTSLKKALLKLDIGSQILGHYLQISEGEKIEKNKFKGTVQQKQRGVKLYISRFILLRAVVASL